MAAMEKSTEHNMQLLARVTDLGSEVVKGKDAVADVNEK